MSNMWIQGIMWIAAAALLLVYLKRRRGRRILP
jgi:membrane protein implicated in regulation of membrane protease activity